MMKFQINILSIKHIPVPLYAKSCSSFQEILHLKLNVIVICKGSWRNFIIILKNIVIYET